MYHFDDHARLMYDHPHFWPLLTHWVMYWWESTWINHRQPTNRTIVNQQIISNNHILPCMARCLDSHLSAAPAVVPARPVTLFACASPWREARWKRGAVRWTRGSSPGAAIVTAGCGSSKVAPGTGSQPPMWDKLTRCPVGYRIRFDAKPLVVS